MPNQNVIKFKGRKEYFVYQLQEIVGKCQLEDKTEEEIELLSPSPLG